MPALFQRPAREVHLLAPDARARPGGLRRHAPECFHVEVEHVAVHRHRVPDAHDELDMERARNEALLLHANGPEDHRKVEYLDLGLDALVEHLGHAGHVHDGVEQYLRVEWHRQRA